MEMKEQKDTAKEALDAAAFAQFRFRPSGRQAGAVLLAFGVPGHDSHRSEGGVDPGDEAQPPIGGVQADHARANVVQMYRPLQERAGMLSRSMADSRIGIAAAPGQNGGTVDNQIARSDQPTTDGGLHRQAEERLRHRRSSAVSAFPLLRGAGNARCATGIERQATGEG